jgi:hypothetical protein
MNRRHVRKDCKAAEAPSALMPPALQDFPTGPSDIHVNVKGPGLRGKSLIMDRLAVQSLFYKEQTSPATQHHAVTFLTCVHEASSSNLGQVIESPQFVQQNGKIVP